MLTVTELCSERHNAGYKHSPIRHRVPAGTAPCPPPHIQRKRTRIRTWVPAGAKPKLYKPGHPERTLLDRTIAEHFKLWLELASAGQFDGQGHHHTPKPFVREAFLKYLKWGIFAHGVCPCPLR